PTSGVSSRIEVLPTPDPTQDAAEFILGMQDTDLPAFYPPFNQIHALPYPSLASIPTLQDFVRDENLTVFVHEGSHIKRIDNMQIDFKSAPPTSLWARRSLSDQENPWNNYGFLMNIYEPNSQRYVDVLQGLWYAFWTGPTPNNVRNSLYLLFGLPTAQRNGT